MAEQTRRHSLVAKQHRDSRPSARRISQPRLPPFNAEREAVEFFYRRERTCPSLPKRILEHIFGSEFVERLTVRAPAAKKRVCTVNQFEDLTKCIRVYARQILTAEVYYTRALQRLPAKAFVAQPAAPQKPRLSIFGTGQRRLSLPQKAPSTRNMDQKRIRSLGFGQVPKGKKVAPVDQLVVDNPQVLRDMMNISVEDHNPRSPVNVLKFTIKAGVVVETHEISQSEIVFYQKGSKLHKHSTRGAQLLDERAHRYPLGIDGLPTSGPKRRYNFIESIFRPQQIWPRHNYEIASQTESMPIGNFRVKVRTFAINDLYAADLKRKKTGETDHGKGEPTQQSSIAMVTYTDAEKLSKAKSDYQASYKLVLVPMHHEIEDSKRKVADGAEWPVHIAPTKLIGLEKQRSIQHIFRGLKLMEKIILQAFHRPIAVDYRYFEDLLDNGRKTGSLMPLWNIHHPRLKDVKLEFAMWHPRYPDMFVCSGGRDEVWDPLIGPGQTAGFICWFSLRNPIYPEYLQYVAKPVMTFDLHSKGYIMAAGTNDGNIMYFNMGIRSDGPVAETNCFDEYHTRTIVALKFLSENLEGDMRFFSVGLEGNYREWTIEKHVQESWRAHELPVAAVRWNPFHKDIFITCGYDYKIQIYDLANIKQGPMMKWNFDVGVRDVQWAPYNSMVFAALLTDGQFLMYDLAYSKYTPVCSQTVAVTSKSRPERIRFNNWGPYVLVSDQSGSVQIFKLSPNLRKIETTEESVTVQPKSRGQPVAKKKVTVRSTKYPGVDLKAQVAKAERLLAIFRDKVAPSLKLDAPLKKYITVGGESLSSVLPDGTECRLSGWDKIKDKAKDKKSF